jgi:hypothetical protein
MRMDSIASTLRKDNLDNIDVVFGFVCAYNVLPRYTNDIGSAEWNLVEMPTINWCSSGTPRYNKFIS